MYVISAQTLSESAQIFLLFCSDVSFVCFCRQSFRQEKRVSEYSFISQAQKFSKCVCMCVSQTVSYCVVTHSEYMLTLHTVFS